MFKVGDFVVRKSDYLTKDWSQYSQCTKHGIVIDTLITEYQWFKVATYDKWIPSHCYTLGSFKNYIKLCQY